MCRKTRLFVRLCLFVTAFSVSVSAQEISPNGPAVPEPPRTVKTAPNPEIEDVKRQLRQQQEEIERLRQIVAEQAKMFEQLKSSLSKPAAAAETATAETAAAERAATETAVAEKPDRAPVSAPKITEQDDALEKRVAKLETETKKTSESISKNQFGSLGFSGEIRLQYDSFYGQLNNSPNIENPAVLGNEINSRHRGRITLRFAVKGKLGADVFTGAFDNKGNKRFDKEFEWGFRLMTGSLANVVSTNQVMTDFFNKKPFSLDQAYIAWRPRPLPGLKIQAGKFETPWMRTEMTFDNDIQVEGLAQSYSRDIKHKFLKNITVHAWQLPMLERNATFVRNSDGTVNLAESSRAGRDLGLYGLQVQGRFELSPDVKLTLAVSDLKFAGTEAISPIQVFGSNLQLPVTVTIPASGTTPARTVTGVATIPRDLLNAGNGNLGLSVATNAAVNRDGRLASGFNLVNAIARFELNQFRFLPVTVIMDYVRNTQVRDVTVAGPGGGTLILENNENQGYWAEIQFRSLRKKRDMDKFSDPVAGDMLFGYTFIRIEKDAVLTPFNYDYIIQQSDIRAHRLVFNYMIDPRVSIGFLGIFNQRPNGLLGVFGNTPQGSLNNPTTRIILDTTIRF